MKPESGAFWFIGLAVVVVAGVVAGGVVYTSYLHSSGAFLRIVASTERSVYGVNETVNVTVTLTNEGAKPVTLAWSCPWDGIRVSNMAGQVVYDSTHTVCPLYVIGVAIAPGETWTHVFHWSADVPTAAMYSIQPEVPSSVPTENVGTSIWVV